MSLVTLAQIKSELKAENTATGATVDQYLVGMARYVTKRWRGITKLDFEPLLRTKTITATEMNISGGMLLLDEPLLEPLTISNNGSALAYGSQVSAYPVDDRIPIRNLLLNDTNDCLSWWPSGCNGGMATGSLYNTIAVNGNWGARCNYDTEAWLDSDDANLLALNASQLTFTVTNADGLNSVYYMPRFSAGNLIMIDSEIMEIDATDIVTNTLTVRRGQRGTTAAAHNINTTIYTWNPEPEVVAALTRWACYGFARKGSFEEAIITDLGNVQYPSDAPKQVYHVAQEYAQW